MIEEFARNLSLTLWDWMAFLVAMLSLIVALLSFIIAKRTLRSQRQTEINTLPVINIVIQELLLKDLIVRLFDGHLRTAAVWNLLNDYSYKYYISERFLALIKIPEDIIHIELFYNNYNNYQTVQGLIDMIKEYNYSIDVINDHMKNPAIDGDVLYLEFSSLISCNNRIASSWSKVMFILFGYESKDISSLFSGFIKDINDLHNGEQKLKYFKSKEIYSDFFDDEVDKRKMLDFMESTTTKLIETYSLNLIERK